MIYPRKLFAKIERFLDSKQVIIVTGMRRVGKTTLLNYFYEKINSSNKIFLDLEDPLNQTIFSQKDFSAIKASLESRGLDFTRKGYLFLDEIQFVSSIPSVVKYFYDHENLKFFLTGSASFYLKNLFSESLAGRKYLFELFPLDFEELLWFKKVNYQLPPLAKETSEAGYLLFQSLIKEYLKWGGMPEVVLLKNSREKELALRDIFTSYFQKEVQALGDFRKNETIRNLIFLLARRVGQKLDIQRLSQELGVARQTIYEYLEFLSGTYFISLIPALGKADVSQRKQRKVYFADSGFFSILESPPLGSVFENAVYQELRHKGEVFYYQAGEREVDFVLKTSAGKKRAFEVKETATFSDIKKAKKTAERLGLKKVDIISLNFGKHPEIKYYFQLSSLPPWIK